MVENAISREKSIMDLQMNNPIYVIEDTVYRVVQNKPIIMIYARNLNNKTDFKTFEWKGNVPYFYCPSREIDKMLPAGCLYGDEEFIDALGRKVVKVFTNIPSEVPQLRGLYSFTDMADFLFEKRCMVDHELKYAFQYINGHPIPVETDNIVPPRIVYYDIEVLSPEGIFPAPQEAKFPVVSIQVMDSYTEQILVFTNSVPQTDDPDHIACCDERELYKVFLTYLDSINPDVLTGWNSSAFDLPYLIRRSWKLEISVDKLARYGKVSCEYNSVEGTFSCRVKGRSTLDMLEAFKKYYIMNAQRETYALKSVSAEYGFEYTDYGPFLEKLLTKNKDYPTFIQYCKNDVISLRNIDKQVNLFEFYETLRKIVGTHMDDVLFNSRLIEMYLMHEKIKPMPTKNHAKAYIEDKFQGALVLVPPPGLHEHVGTVDLAALYPTCMRAFPKETCPDIDLKVIEVLEKIVNKREELRNLRKAGNKDPSIKTREDIFKALANSFYGVCGAPTFRLYKRECAEAVTSYGRQINMFIHETLRSLNYSVLYSDTDSSFFSEVKTVEEGLQMQEFLNNKLIEWGNEHGAKVIFSLKFEKLYRRILFKADKKGEGVKKKYCGFLTWEEGEYFTDKRELNYKGLELKRSDQSEITRNVLHYFLEKVLIDGDAQVAVDYVKRHYKLVKSGNIPIMQVSIPKAIRKVANRAVENPWVRGIKYAEVNYNYILSEGSKPRLLYLTCGREICIDEDFDVTQIINEIDFEMMADKTIKQKMESYMWSIGYDWNKTINGQVGFDQWF